MLMRVGSAARGPLRHPPSERNCSRKSSLSLFDSWRKRVESQTLASPRLHSSASSFSSFDPSSTVSTIPLLLLKLASFQYFSVPFLKITFPPIFYHGHFFPFSVFQKEEEKKEEEEEEERGAKFSFSCSSLPFSFFLTRFLPIF